MYLKELFTSTYQYSIKTLTNELFYIGGLVGGALFYLTGLSVEQLQSVFIIIFADIGTRVWAEWKNKRPILSRKMYFGFVGKFSSYMILFIVANHVFYIGDVLKYIIFGGFSLIETWSVYENLRDAGQKHLKPIGDKIEQEVKKFKNEQN